jgi:hypothetical protein
MAEIREGVDQANANSGGLYSGRRAEEAGKASARVQTSFYDNYMTILQNMASPDTATNLAGFGMNQGVSIGRQNILSQDNASRYDISGAQTNQAYLADLAGGAANLYNGYQSTQPAPQNYADQGGQEPWYL